jgi:hypothetical protein
MTFIPYSIKSILHSSAHFLNQTLVKEGVKNIAGSLTFAFGFVEIYDLYHIAKGRDISTEAKNTSPEWVQVVKKIVMCAKLSLILSAGVSRPGVYIISSLVGRIFSTTQLEKAFGVNTIFAINPWHPRHIISFAAVILALPTIAHSAYNNGKWVYNNIYLHTPVKDSANDTNWLTDSKLRLIVIFNSITSRPLLHMGNTLNRFLRAI